MSSRTRPAVQRPIRLSLALVFVIPLVSLLALWGYAASVTLSNAIQEHNFTTEDNLYGGAAEMVAVDLATERQDAFVWQSSGGRLPESSMLADFRNTQKAVGAFEGGVHAMPGEIIPSARPWLAAFEQQLGKLPVLQARIESGQISAFSAFQTYNAISDAQFDLYSRIVYVNDVALNQQSQASVEAGHALDLADRQVALISGALASGGHMSRAEQQAFAEFVFDQRLLMTDALKQLSPSLGAGYRAAISSSAYRGFEAFQNSVLNSIGKAGPIPVGPLQFAVVTPKLFAAYQKAETQDRVALTKQGTQVGNKALLELVLAGGLGLVAVVLSILLMTRFARRVSRELRGLQGAALALATDKLPGVVEKLGQGEEVDVASEAAPIRVGRIAEITKVAEAFGALQRMAVESAVGQARLRRGVSQVFRNLAWRSQSLLHRQLSLLDAMERKTADPDALEELFRLDHLTTRMRRHAEGLIILSGAEPGRAWRDPVPILDVLRGAIAEIEDYKRVTVLTDSEDAVVGSVVADLIHLLAELVENATFYSPATTEVTVKAGRVANGFAVEVEDRGIGISEEELARVNDRLANPPEFDPVNSDQLGLFVVARLAARHKIRITLRQSPYGGTAAIVLLPHAIVVARGRVYTELDGAIPGWLHTAAERPAIPPALDRAGLRGFGRDAGSGEFERPAGLDATGAVDPDTVIPGPGIPGPGIPGTGVPATGSPVGGTANGDGIPVLGSGLPQRRPRVSGADAISAAGAPASPSATAPVPGADGLTGPGGLPRRVRQASLAPQLKTDVPVRVDDAAEPDPAEGRSPDESRALVDALQFGWTRGRTDADGDAAESPDLAVGPEESTEGLGGSAFWPGGEGG